MNNQQQSSSFQRLAVAVSTKSLRAEMRQMHEEANERGISVLRVEQEHLEAEHARRQADAARMQALLADPATLRALRAQWAPRTRQADGTFPPIPALPQSAPEPAPRDPSAPPSAGRIISPPRR